MNCPLTKPNTSNLTTVFYNSAKEINKKDWCSVNSGSNIYLTINYIEALEVALQNEIQFRYILFYDEEKKPVAIALTQIVRFTDTGSKYNAQLCLLKYHLKAKILKSLDIKVLVCGNVFSTGENGFMFTSDITSKTAYEALDLGLEELRKSEKLSRETSAILLKDFWPSSFEETDILKQKKFRDFMVDVNMVLKIHHSWNSLADYLASMTSKFRTKAKSVFKKSKEITVKELTIDAIVKYQSRIEELYSFVHEKADFNIGKLNGEAFLALKTKLGNQFLIRGYFKEEKMVGFSTAIVFKGMLDANYVGIDYEYNIAFALYQKMLYDFVEYAIEHDISELRLGRTAEEIKSCLGAEPTNMKLYIKHKNTVSNKLLKPLIDAISPSEFELRKPFKAQFSF